MTVVPIPSLGRAARIDDVVARMESIVEALPAADGVAAFTRLYLAATQAVRAAATDNTFEEPATVRWLDEIARRAEQGDLAYLQRAGRVFQLVPPLTTSSRSAGRSRGAR